MDYQFSSIGPSLSFTKELLWSFHQLYDELSHFIYLVKSKLFVFPDTVKQQSLPMVVCLIYPSQKKKKIMHKLTVPLPRLVGKKCQQKAHDMANQRKDETDGQQRNVWIPRFFR